MTKNISLLKEKRLAEKKFREKGEAIDNIVKMDKYKKL